MLSKINIIEKNIQTLSDLNQQIQLFGFSLRNKNCKILQIYCRFLNELEKSFLTVWHHHETLDESQLNQWLLTGLQHELSDNGKVIQLWNQFLICFYQEDMPLLQIKNKNLWTSFLGFKVTDQHYIHSLIPNYETSSYALTLLIDIFQKLNQSQPDTLILDFLSIFDPHQVFSKQIQLLQHTKKTQIKKKASRLDQIIHYFISSKPHNLNKILLNYWKNETGGIINFNTLFLFQPNLKQKISPIQQQSTIQFQDLFELDHNTQKLIQNTKHFLENKVAQNILLWGARGSGKSSSIQALMNFFHAQPLKLIEVNQSDLSQLTLLQKELKKYQEKFIIFIDDITFSTQNTDYKELQSLMEGSLQHLHKNYIFYVTSNLKSLVNNHKKIDQNDAEARQKNDELKAIDDRFGLKLRYENLQFSQLQAMLITLAQKKNIALNPEELKIQFNKFCLYNQHDQPSGRTIKQFLETYNNLNIKK